MLLLPFLLHARWAGIILVIMALFGSFYHSARGGSPIMGMFMTLAITMVVTVGSVSGDINAAFYTRLLSFIAIAIYGTIAVVVFDTFWPSRQTDLLAAE